MATTRKQGRDGGNGQWIPVEKAIRLGDKAVVETVKFPSNPTKK